MPTTQYLRITTAEVRLGDKIARVPDAPEPVTEQLRQGLVVKSIKTGTKYVTFTDGVSTPVRVPRGDTVCVLRQEPTEDETRASNEQAEILLLDHRLRVGLGRGNALRSMLRHVSEDPDGPFLDHRELDALLTLQHEVRFFTRVNATLVDSGADKDILGAFAQVIYQDTRDEGYDSPLNGPSSLTVRLEQSMRRYTARRFLNDHSSGQGTALHRRLHQIQESGM